MAKFNKKQLRAIINESIKEIIIENRDDCFKWQTGNSVGYNGFLANCCEGGEGCDTTSTVNGCQGFAQTAATAVPSLDPCDCCRYGGTVSTLDCSLEGIHAGNATRECWACQKEGDLPGTCDQLLNMGLTVAQAQQQNLTLYNDSIICNAQSDCGPRTGTGGKCDPTDGTYYGFNGGSQGDNHNERWGRDCWFCKEDNMPGCTQIVTPMLQGEAFAAYQAGTSGIHGTDTGCNAVEKCGDDGTGNSSLKCHCCNKSGLGVSPLPNPNYKSCSSHNGQNGMYGCQPVNIPLNCKKPLPTNPTLQSKIANPNPPQRTRVSESTMKNIIKNMLKNK